MKSEKINCDLSYQRKIDQTLKTKIKTVRIL
jgi:hypothetical protein